MSTTDSKSDTNNEKKPKVRPVKNNFFSTLGRKKKEENKKTSTTGGGVFSFFTRNQRADPRKANYFRNLSLDAIQFNVEDDKDFEFTMEDFDPEIYRQDFLESQRHTTKTPPCNFAVKEEGIFKKELRNHSKNELSKILVSIPIFVKSESLKEIKLTSMDSRSMTLKSVEPFEFDDECSTETGDSEITKAKSSDFISSKKSLGENNLTKMEKTLKL